MAVVRRARLLRGIFVGASGVRTIWVLVVFGLLIVVGEVVLVDPLGRLFEWLGFPQLSGVTTGDWRTALGSSAKRVVRMAVVTGAAYVVLRGLLAKPLGFVGMRFEKGAVRLLTLGLGLGTLIQVVSVLLMLAFGWYRVVGVAWELNPSFAMGPALLYLLAFCFETGVIEEVIFRGLLLNVVASRYGLRAAVVVSSVLFGGMHFSGFTAEFPWWASVVTATLAGLFFAQAYLYRSSLWLPIGIHAGWHLAARLLGDTGITPGDSVLLVTDVKGPILLVNTRAGGAAIFEMLGVLAASLILWQLARRRKRSGSAAVRPADDDARR